jgi:multiple sugar transport system permease protein
MLPGKSFVANFKNLMDNAQLPVIKGMMNSLFVSAASALLAVYFSALTAFAIHAYEFRFKKIAFTFIMVIMMVPTQVSALGFIKLMSDMKLMNSFIPLIVPCIASPIVFFFIKQYMESVLPMELIEAARIDGAHEFRIFNQIVLPLMKPAIAVQAIFTFVSSWNNYFVPSLLINKAEMKTLPLLIAQLRSADFLKFDMGQVYMMIAFAILPVVIVYMFLSKYIVRGVMLGGVKG